MSAPLLPARLAFAEGGTPYSAEFGDVYHSAEGGLGQARHVFLAGNGLPERWRGRSMDVLKAAGDAGLIVLVAGPDVVRIAPSLGTQCLDPQVSGSDGVSRPRPATEVTRERVEPCDEALFRRGGARVRGLREAEARVVR